MANKKLLSEAIEAFINRDETVAAAKLRAFFVESAQEINKKMEEDFDADADSEELSEDMNQDPNQDFSTDVGFKLSEEDEKFGAEEETDEPEFGAETEVGAEEVPEFGAEGTEVDDVQKPAGLEEDEWQSVKDAMSGLTALFAEIYNSQEEGTDEAEQGEEQAQAGEHEAETELDDVEFGDEKLGESFKLKEVPAVDKTEKAGVQKKASTPANAKSVVPGVKPAMPGKNTETVNDKTFDNKDHDAVKVDDQGNILSSDKEVQKPVKAPKPAQAPSSTKAAVPARK